MFDLSFPERRTPAAARRDREFIELLDTMLAENDTITARAIARRLTGVDHPSSITRDTWRRARVEEWQGRQKDMRGLIEKARKQSKTSLAAVMEQKDARIRDLEAEVDLLRASHRAMIKAVGELGGMQAWLRLFNRYEALVEQMKQSDAFPRP